MMETMGQAKSMVGWVFSPQLGFDLPAVSAMPALESRDYECRLARDRSELRRVFQLRYEVFRQEYRSPASWFKIDVDDFDRYADHLVVFEKATGLPVGTYRLLEEGRAPSFYSAKEFSLEPFLKRPGKKLELGRACVHPQHRNGTVLRMLWRAVTQFAQERQIDLLFGCSSVLLGDAHAEANWSGEAVSPTCGLIDSLFQEMTSRGAWEPETGVAPLEKYRMPASARDAWRSLSQGWLKQGGGLELSGESATLTERKSSRVLPPLVLSYIRSGARMIAEPAWDADFHCLDLLTAFPISRKGGEA
jgi:putative hemolysin